LPAEISNILKSIKGTKGIKDCKFIICHHLSDCRSLISIRFPVRDGLHISMIDVMLTARPINFPELSMVPCSFATEGFCVCPCTLSKMLYEK
jgi:hypothetical protein